MNIPLTGRIICRDGEIPINVAFLSQHNRVWKSMLDNTDTVTLDKKVATIQAIIDYLYHETTPQDTTLESLLDIYAAADAYQILGLTEWITELLQEKIEMPVDIRLMAIIKPLFDEANENIKRCNREHVSELLLNLNNIQSRIDELE